MKSILKKLNVTDQNEILVLNIPDDFDKDFHTIEGIEIYESLIQITKIEYALLFVLSAKELEDQIQTLNIKLKDDAILWVIHPIASESLGESYNWKPLTNLCFENVETKSILHEWRAVRFRKLEYLHCKETSKRSTQINK